MNGSVSPIPQIALANPVVQLLESFLVEAKAGEPAAFCALDPEEEGGIARGKPRPGRGRVVWEVGVKVWEVGEG